MSAAEARPALDGSVACRNVDRAIRQVVSERLSAVLSHRGITQTELARASGVSRSCISRVIAKQRPISADALVRICLTLDVDINWLLGLRRS